MSQLDWIRPDWPAPENVAAFTTTRNGGCSQGNYSSFNLGHHVGDDAEHVKFNRDVLNKQLHLPSEPIWLNQGHGTDVLEVTSLKTSNPEADAAYTTEVRKVCVVLTADCLPVLFCDSQGSCVAVVHAGWRGLLRGVLECTLNSLPIESSQLLCWLGPAIGPTKFEVGAEVREQFIQKDPEHKGAFDNIAVGKYLANLYKMGRHILNTQGVKAIYGGGYCTFSDDQRFYSYRRDGQTGRMASLIWLKS